MTPVTRPRRAPVRRLSSREDLGFHVLNYAGLWFLTILVIYPVVYVLSASISDAKELASGQVVLWPVGLDLGGYETIFSSPALLRGLANSVAYTVIAAVIGTALTVASGYVLSRRDLPGRRLLAIIFVVPMLFPPGIIPSYLVVRNLNLLDTVAAVVIPGALSVFNVLITTTFFSATIPTELLEAAQLDGASDLKFFVSVALPLSAPIIAVNLLFYGIAQWNGWFNAFLYLDNPDLYPLQLVLRDILAESQIDPTRITGANLDELLRQQSLLEKLKYSMIVLAMIPPLIAYPFVQRHFVKGALVGSLK